MALLVLVMLTAASDHLECHDANTLSYFGKSTAVFVDFITRFAVICTSFLPRLVLVRTIKVAEQGWQSTIKGIGQDYRRGLSMRPMYSDDEGDESQARHHGTELA